MLSELHTIKIAHRDLKASNILVALDSESRPLVTIIDWSTAIVTGESFCYGFSAYGIWSRRPGLVFPVVGILGLAYSQSCKGGLAEF